MDFLKKKMKDLLKEDDATKEKSHHSSPEITNYHYDSHGSQPPYGSNSPQLPPGWHAQFDQQSQRWYYVEQATGRTQWEMPTPFPQGSYQPPPHGAVPQYGGHGGYGHHGSDQAGVYGPGSHGHEEKKDKHGSGTGKVLAAGAIGAVGGAWLGHELTEGDSDDEHRAVNAAPPVAAPNPGDGFIAHSEPSYVVTAPEPEETADGSSVSSSDKEELEERREELEEAQEAYDEQYEETYDD